MRKKKIIIPIVIIAAIAIIAVVGYNIYRYPASFRSLTDESLGEEEVTALRNEIAALEEKDILVAYFSHSGTTRGVAAALSSEIDADLFEISPKEEYSNVYTQSNSEIRRNARPALSAAVDNMEKYELGIAVAKLNDFIWEEFCDWYIEMVKPRLYNDADETKTAAIWTLKTVLIDALKLLHPYMPFITEEIFCNIQDEEESIMISSWPVYDETNNFAAEEKAIETIKEAVRNIRNLRADMNVAPSRKALVYVVTASEDVKNIFNNSLGFFGTLAYASEVKVQADKAGIPEDAVSTVIPDAVIYIPFAELVDIDKEIERLKKEEGRLQGEIKRCNGMLNNERFTSKAPKAKIDEEKAKLVKYTQMLEQVTERLATLSK